MVWWVRPDSISLACTGMSTTSGSAEAVTWAMVSRETGVSASTIRRLETADDAEADGVLALIRWLGVSPETYVDAARRAGEPLPTGAGVVRIDMTRVAAAAGEPTRGRERTTIQRLVEAALRVDVSIASLTRMTAS